MLGDQGITRATDRAITRVADQSTLGHVAL
jgi:hypothetical protein